MLTRVLIWLGFGICAAALWSGLDYYALPLVERPFSPLHATYAPSGLVGQGLGVVGTLMILCGVVGYSLRKRVRFLSRLGPLRAWLHVHIFLCLVGPFLVLLHTTFKFGGLVSIAFWSMALVVASGAFGRWVYVWIPKTVNGRFLGIRELQEQIRDTLEGIRDRTALSPERISALIGEVPATVVPVGVAPAVYRSLRYRLGRRRERGRMERRLAAVGVEGRARDEIVDALELQRRAQQQMQLMHPFQRAFRYWHAFHLPLAVVMLLILVVHVGVSIAFGYTWIL